MQDLNATRTMRKGKITKKINLEVNNERRIENTPMKTSLSVITTSTQEQMIITTKPKIFAEHIHHLVNLVKWFLILLTLVRANISFNK